MPELRVLEGGGGANGLTRVGMAVVGLLVLLGGCLMIGWGAASKYQTDLALIHEEQTFQGTQLDLILTHLGIPRPERRK